MENDKIKGLSKEEVESRIKDGKCNYIDEPKTKTIKEIFISNIVTYFNILNIILAGLIIISGILSGQLLNSLKNCLFVGVIFTNTVISIIEEILAKKTVDKLNVISETKIKVIRDGKEDAIDRESLVLDDTCIYTLGNQVVTDVVVLSGKVEVNESFITGESKPITKESGDSILSGSFVVSGKCYARVEHIGKDNYISKITSEAKYVKATNSIIYNSFDKMLKILSICLIPVGILFFVNQLVITNYDISESLLSTVSALIGMIPEGLVLLTSSAMAVSVIRLKKFNVLVQDLYSIENLARVDVICLDKTGTITTGNMTVDKIIPSEEIELATLEHLLGNYINCLEDNSATMLAIKTKISKFDDITAEDTLPFSSVRKYSGVKMNKICYYLGSPENILKKVPSEIKKYQEDYRVLTFVEGGKKLGNLDSVKILGFILIHDEIKENASETLNYFKSEGVIVKIISGDNEKTVSKIAEKVGFTDIKSIDMTEVEDKDIESVANTYNIFGRVKPEQKKKLIMALKNAGHYVAMTGDGVNDCLALKIADCSIAMASGSDAAKNVSQFVLLDDNIDDLPFILKEGRRSINNIERSSTLLLNKTIFTITLIIACILLSVEYFFEPIHLTLITACTISIPSFILALENNHDLVKGNFLQKVFLKSFPCALTVVFNVVIVTLFERAFTIDSDLCTTIKVILTAITGFINLNYICKPYDWKRAMMCIILLLAFLYCIFFQYDFFNMSMFTADALLIFIILFICSIFIYDRLRRFSNYLLKKTKNA